MNNIIQSFDSNINVILENYIRKPTLIKAVVQLLLMLYAVRLAPTPPPVVLHLFNNVYFKVFIFALILWTAQVSPSTSILIAVAFMITINYTTTGKIWEMMDNTAVPPVSSALVTPAQSAQAVQVLAQASSSAIASPANVVAPVANIALSNISSSAGALAVKSLVQQSTTPVSGTPDKVAIAVQTAMTDISSSSNNVSTPSPVQSIQAIKVLSEMAASPVSAPVSTVTSLANIAMSNSTTSTGSAAIQALATQSVTPVSGTPENVASATQTAMNSITPVPVSSSQALQAIQALGLAAASTSAAPSSMVIPAANIAASTMTDASGVAAIQSLAEQAMLPSPGTAEKVSEAVQTAISSVGGSTTVPVASASDQTSQPAIAAMPTNVASTDAGCYPLRNYDMKKVMPMKDGALSFEDYQQFVSTSQ